MSTVKKWYITKTVLLFDPRYCSFQLENSLEEVEKMLIFWFCEMFSAVSASWRLKCLYLVVFLDFLSTGVVVRTIKLPRAENWRHFLDTTFGLHRRWPGNVALPAGNNAECVRRSPDHFRPISGGFYVVFWSVHRYDYYNSGSECSLRFPGPRWNSTNVIHFSNGYRYVQNRSFLHAIFFGVFFNKTKTPAFGARPTNKIGRMFIPGAHEWHFLCEGFFWHKVRLFYFTVRNVVQRYNFQPFSA